MKKQIRTLGRIGAVLALLFCLTGGVWIVTAIQFDDADGSGWTGTGFYFMGSAFFVGPMLWIAAERLMGKDDEA